MLRKKQPRMDSASLSDVTALAYGEVSEAEVEIRRRDMDLIGKVIFDAITNLLAAGKSVSISKFGTFIPKVRAARVCRNPKHPDQPVTAPERVAVVFKSSTILKADLNPKTYGKKLKEKAATAN